MKISQLMVPPSKRIKLTDYDPDSTAQFANESEAQQSAEAEAEDLAKYQDILLAHETHAVLIIFQAMDGAGKDDTIKRVMSSVDPQGCRVSMFGEPSGKDLKHDYLWRYVKALPESGQIGIFNRSYYEQLVTERIHPRKLKEWQLPTGAKKKSDALWKRRYQEVNNFEKYLTDNGIVILKFFLNISKQKQRERLLERTHLPEKMWKFSQTDIEDRQLWGKFMKVYEETLNHTSTKWAPWHIIPANSRWVTRATVASLTVAALKSLHSQYPKMDEEQTSTLAKAQRLLEKEKSSGKR